MSSAFSQTQNIVRKDSSKQEQPSAFKTGFYPLSFFDFDLRYLVKYNNYEGFRLGFGGITNESLSKYFRVGGYIARGFRDDTYKYSLGGNILIKSKRDAWISLYYTDDINEIGSHKYLTDARVYSVFESRLVNITQFYKHRTWRANYRQEISSKINSEIKLSRSNITQIENYQFVNNQTTFSRYVISEAALSIRISPYTKFLTNEDGNIEYYDGFPKISFQITQGFKDFFDGDFEYTKLGLKLDYYIKRTNLSSTNIILEGNLGLGDIPLTHLFHAYPNNPTKDEILQRFSVAGQSSFETMYFGEFFSDKLATLQIKHSLRRFYFSKKMKPELVFITRHAIGNLSNKEKHVGLQFNTLDKFYSESGFELNKILFGFGLSFAYRYGAYHLDDFEDNVSFKFTFNLSL